MSHRASIDYGVNRLRTATKHFFVGMAGNILFAFAASVLTVRWLTPPDYAAFVLLTSLILILGVVATLGLREASQRFLPEYAVTARQDSGRRLGRAVLAFLGVYCVALLLTAGGVYAMAPWLAKLFGMESLAWSFQLACLVLIPTNLLFFSNQLLEILLRQGLVKWLVICLAFLKLSMLVAVHTLTGKLVLRDVLLIEFLCSALLCLPSLYALLKYSRKDKPTARTAGAPSKPQPGHGEEQGGLLRRIVPFAAYNYLMLLALTFQEGAVNKLVVGAVLPVSILALFGFAQTLVTYIQRYLPNMLLIYIIRPALMAHWTKTKDSRQFSWMLNIFVKINLFLLLPVLAWLALSGNALAGVISGGKYYASGQFVFGLSCLLVFHCTNRRYELALQALERSRLLFVGNLFVVGAVLLSVLLTALIGAWGIILASALGLLARDVFMHVMLSRRGFELHLDVRGLIRLLLPALLAWALLWLVIPQEQGLGMIFLSGAGCLGLYLLFARAMRPFTDEERAALNGLIGRRLFFW